jgi:hypothetical protein
MRDDSVDENRGRHRHSVLLLTAVTSKLATASTDANSSRGTPRSHAVCGHTTYEGVMSAKAPVSESAPGGRHFLL